MGRAFLLFEHDFMVVAVLLRDEQLPAIGRKRTNCLVVRTRIFQSHLRVTGGRVEVATFLEETTHERTLFKVFVISILFNHKNVNSRFIAGGYS